MNKITYAGDVGGVGPSYVIWGDCPVAEIALDPNVGVGFFDDFVGVPQFTDNDTSYFNGYAGYVDTGTTFKPQAGVVGGIIEVANNDADNDEAVLSVNAPAFQVSDTDGDDLSLWFEARVKRASIADNACAMFVGLAWDHGNGVSVAKTLCLTDNDGALGAFSFLGFHVDAANGDAIDFVYKADSQTAAVLIAGVDVPVADTFAKLGFRYDPSADTAKRITIFVDGVEQSTYVTGTIIEAVTFPDAEPMAPTWAAKTGSTAASKAQMDWIRCYQMR